MSTIHIDRNTVLGKIRPMHCVNNGPIPIRNDQTRGNADTYKALEIPYARNHDASFCASYGGPHSVDILAVFPRFEADENDPASYDFHLTDEYILRTLEAGTETFYRLGTRIEHETKKYGTLPPPDFHKWARICEHIIRHYNEGWANGYRLNITYWEIWNEPNNGNDLNLDKKLNWCGTRAQFFDLFTITAKHLKTCFPHLKIGGPATCGGWPDEWIGEFLEHCAANQVPMDFFSWHRYENDPKIILSGWKELRQKLDSLGYQNTESICNEWNYVWDWNEHFIDSILVINGLKGAAFTAATMLHGQRDTTIDMLMYYDFRPCVFCGPFNFYTLKPQKPYYPFLMYSKLYKSGTQIAVTSDDELLYTAGAKGKDGKIAVMAAYYGNEDDLPEKTITVTGLQGDETLWLLTEDNDTEKQPLISTNGTATLTIKPYTVLLIESV